MFKLFKKKLPLTSLVAPVAGKLIQITEVKDDMFSQKMIGDGFAVIPTSNQLVAPATGTISAVFPTKHALGITTPSGLEIMLHLGIDTVELNGVPFNIAVTKGQAITEGTAIGTMSVQNILDSKKDPTVMVIITNMDQVSELPAFSDHDIAAGATVLDVTTQAMPTA